MSVSRWKVMACSLGLSLGGLAICAGQSNDRLNAPANPATPTPTEPPSIVLPEPPKITIPEVAPDTLPPIQITPMAREMEIEVPRLVVPVQATSPVPAVPPPPSVDLPVFEVSPAPNREKLPVPRVSPPAVPMDIDVPLTITPAAPTIDIGTAPAVTPQPKTPAVPVPTVPDMPPVPSAPIADPPALPPAPPAPSNPPPTIQLQPMPQQQQQLLTTAATTRLKMLLRLGDGKPRFEIRTSDSVELLFKVYGEKIEMQSAPEGAKASPIAGVTAIGKVRFVGPSIEGTCDQLTVLSGTGEVMLKGNVLVKTKRGKAWSEMTTEKMIYQIGATGLTTTPSSSLVRPAAFQESR